MVAGPCRSFSRRTMLLLVAVVLAMPALGENARDAYEAARRALDGDALMRAGKRCAAEGERALAVQAFRQAVSAYGIHGDKQKAVEAQVAWIDAAQKVGDASMEAEGEMGLGCGLKGLPGRASEAMPHFKRAAEIAEGMGKGGASDLILLARYVASTDREYGLHCLSRAEALAAAAGDPILIAYAIIARAESFSSDVPVPQRVAELQRAVGMIVSETSAGDSRLFYLGAALGVIFDLKAYDEAGALCQQILAIPASETYTPFPWIALNDLTAIAWHKGDPAGALAPALGLVRQDLAALGRTPPDELIWARVAAGYPYAVLPTLHYLRAYDRAMPWLEAWAEGLRTASVPSDLLPRVLIPLGAAYYYRGDFGAAEDALAEAGKACEGDAFCASIVRLWQGRVRLAQGNIDGATAAFTEAWSKAEHLTPDTPWDKACLDEDFEEARLDFATARLESGKPDEAAKLAGEALRIAQISGDLSAQSDALAVLSFAHEAAGNAAQAAKDAEQALDLAKQSRDQAASAVAAHAAGWVYSSLGAGEVSADASDAVFHDLVKSRAGLPYAYRRRGQALLAQGHYPEAKRAYEAALRMDHTTGNVARLGDDECGLGNVAVAQGDWATAAARAGEAVAAAREAGYKLGEADALSLAVEAALALGKTEDAQTQLQALTALGKELDLTPLKAQTMELSGRLAEVQGRDDEALGRYMDAAAELEKLRAEAGAEPLLVSFGARAAGTYDRMVGLLAKKAEQGEVVQAGAYDGQDAGMVALHYAEEARARALLARMGGALVERFDDLNDAEKQEVKGADDALAAARSAVWQATGPGQDKPADMAKLTAALRKAEADREVLRTRLMAKHPAASVRAGREPVLEPGDMMQVCVDRMCAALEFWVGEKESWGWVVNPWKREAKLFKVKLGRQEIADLVGRLQSAMTKTPPANDLAEVAEGQLSDALIGPAGALLPQGKPLVIVPDGPLCDLPFALLTCQGKRLLDRAPIAYAPSLSLLRAMGDAGQRPAGALKVTVLARPKSPDPRFVDLPGTEKEAKAVAEAVPGATVLLGDKATEAAARQAAGETGILHLAAHGIVDRVRPDHSAVLLSAGDGQDGLLEAEEIARLPIRARLVVLSACRSAGGGYVAGEGMLGLTRAFFAGGATGVVATQWQVPDDPVADLMKAFYAALTKSGSPARALQAAQIEMAQTQPAAAWAPFAFYGAP